MSETGQDASSKGLYSVIHSLLNIVWLIIFIPVISMISLVGFYIWSIFERSDKSLEASRDIRSMLAGFWENVNPVAGSVLKAIVPIVILLVVVGLLKWFTPEKLFNSEGLKDNLPSLMALVVIVTICIVAISGNVIPHELSSIGLVVIGYYFGKVKV